MPPALTFAGNPLDRASERRGDADWLAERWRDPGALAVAVWNGQLLVERASGGGVQLAYAPAGLARTAAPDEDRQVSLGRWKGRAVFAVDCESSLEPSEGPLQGLGRFEDLRALAPRLPAADSGIGATAKGVFEWTRRCRFCSACGGPVQARDGGWKRACAGCGAEHFPRTDPVVIMLAAHGDQCLLGRQPRFPKGMFSALAGFVEPGESVEEACARELKEEAGLTATDVRYQFSQPWPFPASLMLGLIAEVADMEATPDQTELEAVRWFSRADARALLAGELADVSAPPPLAVAHHLIRAWAEQD